MFGILSGAIIATAWLVSAYASAATKSDVSTAIHTHGKAQHDQTARDIKAIQAVDVEQNTSIARIESDVSRLKGMDSKLELLTRHAIMKAGDKRVESTQLRRAANKIRMDALARGEDDPFDGIEFKP